MARGRHVNIKAVVSFMSPSVEDKIHALREAEESGRSSVLVKTQVQGPATVSNPRGGPVTRLMPRGGAGPGCVWPAAQQHGQRFLAAVWFS